MRAIESARFNEGNKDRRLNEKKRDYGFIVNCRRDAGMTWDNNGPISNMVSKWKVDKHESNIETQRRIGNEE